MTHIDNPLNKLFKLIVETHSLDELRTLCFLIGVRYDGLGGEGVEAKTRELIIQIGRRRQFSKLLEVLEETRKESIQLSNLIPDLHTVQALDGAYAVFQIEDPLLSHITHANDSIFPKPKEIKVLVIEDIPAQYKAISQLLTEMGLTATIASDFDTALKFIRMDRFDLITLDMQLDNMDASGQAGVTLLDQMRTYQRRVPIIIISGLPWSGTNVRDFLREYGAYDYLTKPFKPEYLKKCIEKALKSYQSTD